MKPIIYLVPIMIAATVCPSWANEPATQPNHLTLAERARMALPSAPRARFLFGKIESVVRHQVLGDRPLPPNFDAVVHARTENPLQPSLKWGLQADGAAIRPRILFYANKESGPRIQVNLVRGRWKPGKGPGAGLLEIIYSGMPLAESLVEHSTVVAKLHVNGADEVTSQMEHRRVVGPTGEPIVRPGPLSLDDFVATLGPLENWQMTDLPDDQKAALRYLLDGSRRSATRSTSFGHLDYVLALTGAL